MNPVVKKKKKIDLSACRENGNSDDRGKTKTDQQLSDIGV